MSITTTFVKKLLMAAAGATFLSLGASLAKAPPAEAAIFSVDDSGSRISGSNTISNLGFNMVAVPNGDEPLFSNLSSLSSPLGTLSFSSPVNKRGIGNGWATWSNGYTGEVYFNNGSTTTTITLPSLIGAFDLYVEPNLFSLFEIKITAIGGTTTTLSQFVNGFAGAKYFGFYATDGEQISSITITDKSGSAGGFAFGQMYLAQQIQAVPEPASVLGLLAVGAIGAAAKLQRKQQQEG
ncbi:PEP-CTERM sorting domain-containing protein [Microseira wollei]|uniref:Ice-binding protein C-terminal domain-containing protein n=1 Tax=Microseira wollei NIES-4236 TaxID=2530354 RepID=A0AAV3XH05_9CYAN|nr:PEP-CTERM sorting domain-containing protein [Microseira wollei]GET39697.1 exported hypothetical protein [Microseira wollei NIES-4236]